MAGTASDESGVGRSTEEISSGDRCQTGEALAEWRSSEQVENGTPSTSPPYWDTDDDDDGGPKPSELYGKYTWKIENFSQINKRELRSNAFEVGGYKWYILIYPQGCDVCNHLSLFLCVANHDKLLPGWSHFAQFTIAVVNKDPKKSKYSDTLHRFWKKEHDWGWKKFMELSKVLDGFIELDTLIIKAQVQVIREKADRPFRCLDCQYRRELVRVYLTNVEQICRRFVEERRGKLEKLIKDKARWPSFCTFWLGIDQNARRRMSREKTDVILKVVVKHFFIEKEVTSTLVMDSLYSGMKALEGQSKSKKARLQLLDSDEIPAPVVQVEKDMFVLVDDVLLLLERAALEPLPPKEDKGPQNRTKEGSSGEDFHKDSIERDERRLTELGRRTVEIFVLAHIFSNKIEVAYQEAVALKRQEELIREEEVAWQIQSELKAKRGATEKEKKSKKKQAKQKRNNRKGKEKGKDERSIVPVQEECQSENHNYDIKDSVIEQVEPVLEKPDTLEDVSDVSDSVDDVVDVLQPDSEERDASPVSWDTDTSEIHPSKEASSSGISGLTSVQNGSKKSPSVIDDSSSTCSTDSVPSVVMNGPYKGNSLPSYKKKSPSSRGKNHISKVASDGNVWASEVDNQPFGPVGKACDGLDISARSKAAEPDSGVFQFSKWPELKKEEEFLAPKKMSAKDQVNLERPKEKTVAMQSSPKSPPKKLPSTSQPKTENERNVVMDSVPVRKTSSNGPHQIDIAAPLVMTSQATGMSKSDMQKAAAPRIAEIAMSQPVPVVSRPSSAPIIPALKPTVVSITSTVAQTLPLLSRSVSAAGRLAPDPSTATQNFVPQSYRNAIIGNHVGSSSSDQLNAPSSGANKSPVYTHEPALVSAPIYLPQISERLDLNSLKSGFSYAMGPRDVLQNGPQWIESSQRDTGRIMNSDANSLLSDIQNLDLYNSVQRSDRERIYEFNACTSGRQTQGGVGDEFPHLDIINELLDDEYGVSVAAETNNVFQSHSNRPQLRNQQYSFLGDMGSTSSSYRFERSRSYQDEVLLQRSYSPSGNHYDQMRDYVPQASPLHYPNGQMDGMIPNNWQVGTSDLSLLGMRNVDGDGQAYYNPNYSNMACGVGNYAMFRPSNEH